MPLFGGAGALIGGIGGLFKSGPEVNMQGRNSAASAMDAYRNLAARGPGAGDVGASLDASRGYAQTLQNIASGGMYDMGAGNRLAEQQFAPQRQKLAQSLQDQMAMANRAATAAGRSSNDPIVRARLGAQAMRSTAEMNAQQGAAAMDLGRQSTTDMLSLGGQRVNLLQGLADQAFSNQSNLFNMGSNLQQLDLGAAQYEQGRGGGLKGALTGALTGAGAGLQFATGLGNISNANALTQAQIGNLGAQNQFMKKMSSNQVAPTQPVAPMNPQYFNPANFAGNNVQYGPQPAPQRMNFSIFAPNSFQSK